MGGLGDKIPDDFGELLDEARELHSFADQHRNRALFLQTRNFSEGPGDCDGFWEDRRPNAGSDHSRESVRVVHSDFRHWQGRLDVLSINQRAQVVPNEGGEKTLSKPGGSGLVASS